MKRNLLILLLLIPFLMGAASRSLDGVGDRLTQGDIFDVGDAEDITICGWTKLTEDASIDVVLGKRTTTGPGYHLAQTTADVMQFVVEETSGAGSSSVTSSATTDCDGIWCWSCGTWEGGEDITEIWINGVREDTDDSLNIGSLSTGAFFRMGADGAATADYDGTGDWAYQVVWDLVVLTSVQINEAMWKPEISGAIPNMLITVWGDASEQDLSANDDPAGVTGTMTISTDGPPVMFGGGLPI